ncbi:MAG: DUF1674 domain-containing protein [Hyphomicrobiaceae bacterium]|nr:DUF1674 domain-containing protein [Hyphomicrobiaceae bacterium]
MAEKSAKNKSRSVSRRKLSPAARRALAEAEERRNARRENAQTGKGEVGGRDGPEPTRYGDWEKDGIVSDF